MINRPLNKHELNRACDAVFKKIERLYGPKERVIPTGDLKNRFEAEIQKILHTPATDGNWLARCEKAIRHSKITDSMTDQKYNEIQRVGEDILWNYLNAFHVQNQFLSPVHSTPVVNPPHSTNYSHVANSMMNLYKNHITNQAQASLQELGFNPVSAHSLNTHLIGRAIQMQLKYAQNKVVLSPQMQRATNDATALSNIAEINDYWKITAARISKAVGPNTRNRS